MNAKTLMVVASLVGVLSASAEDVKIEDKKICPNGGTNAPYTAESPLVCSNLTFVGQSANDSFASFTSGTHWIYGNLLSSGLCYKYSSVAELLITGKDTVVRANTISIENGRDADSFIRTTGKPFQTVIRVTDGAKLVVSNDIDHVAQRKKTGQAGWADFLVSPSREYCPVIILDHATLEIPNGQFKLDRGYACSTGYLYSVDSTVTTKEALKIGHFDTYGSAGAQFVRCTNTTFNVAGLNFNYGSFDAEFVNCRFPSDGTTAYNLAYDAGVTSSIMDTTPIPDLRFIDCEIPHLSSNLGYPGILGRMPHITFDGGSVRFDRLAVAYGNGAVHMTITNGAKVVLGFDNLEVGNSRTGLVDIAYSTLVITNSLYLGREACDVTTAKPSTGGGYLNVGDGAYVDVYNSKSWGSGAGSIYVGCNESSILNVSGGGLAARSISIGYDTSKEKNCDMSAGTYKLVQTDGVITNAAGDGYGGTIVAYSQKTHATLELNGGRYVTTRIYGGAGDSTLLANGGTIVAGHKDLDTGNLISSFTRAKVGPKGLTIEVNDKIGSLATSRINMSQAFENQEGVEGLVVKSGSGLLKFAPPSWTVSKTVVCEGVLQVTPSDLTLETSLVVTNGAVLSLQDGQVNTLTVDKLELLGCTLAIDPGDKIVVTGEADISALTLNVSSKPETGTDLTIIEAGTLSARSAKALVRAMSEGFTFDEKTYGKFTVSDDGDKVSVKFTVKVEADPLTGDALTTWQGTSSDGWTSDGSWTGGVPAVGKKAVFPAAAAEKSVVIPDGATATALSFGGDYALASGSLVLDGDRGAVEIEATAGETSVSTPVALRDVTSVPVAAGAALALNGPLADGGFTKTGSGRLELGAANTLALPVTLAGGLVSVADGGAFGESRVTLKKDTLEVNAGDAEIETVIPNKIEINVDSQYKGVILKTDTPATMPVIKSVQGALLKRGVAPLTLECRNGDRIMGKRACGNMNTVQGWLEFPEDGTFDIDNSTAAGASFTAFTIAEGEVVLKPAPGETLPTVMADADGTYVGVKHTNGTVRARMTLDGVRYNCGDRSVFLCGYNAGNPYIDLPGGAVQIPLVWELLKSELCICNGAILSCGTFTSSSYGNRVEMAPTLALTNGTLAAVNVVFSYNNITPVSLEPTARSRIRAKDSTLTASTGFKTMLRTDGDFDNTFFGSPTEGTLGTMTFTDGAAGTMLFRNGSVFACAIDFGTFRRSYPLAGETMTLAFDDAEWRYGTGDFTFDPVIPNDAADAFLLEMRGKGVKLAPAEGTTFETRFPFTGEGGLIVDGPGTVKFAADTLKFKGAACVRQGTLDAGGQAVAISLRPGDEVPTLKDCAPRGRILVDMSGASCEKGDSFPVARISGSTPLRFKAVNFADPELYGYFTVQDGLVTMTVGPKPGLSIIVR